MNNNTRKEPESLEDFQEGTAVHIGAVNWISLDDDGEDIDID